MGVVGYRRPRNKQINVRLNTSDVGKFQYIMNKLHHQTVSDTVRDLLRVGYIDISIMDRDAVADVIKKLPSQYGRGNENRELQLNVRLNKDEHTMTEELMNKMDVYSISEVIRYLISIYHFVLIEKETMLTSNNQMI